MTRTNAQQNINKYANHCFICKLRQNMRRPMASETNSIYFWRAHCIVRIVSAYLSCITSNNGIGGGHPKRCEQQIALNNEMFRVLLMMMHRNAKQTDSETDHCVQWIIRNNHKSIPLHISPSSLCPSPSLERLVLEIII